MAVLLLTATWRRHIPMMLWDHLDLLPIYVAWQNGTLAQSDLLHIHGGHLHTIAYAVLLVTTALSHGNPLLDCLVSWCLLGLYGGVLVRLAIRSKIAERGGIIAALALVFLIFHPAHLANLQWGWQVAVFLCLSGAVVAIGLLTENTLSVMHCIGAVIAGCIALLSFATAAALVPTALIVLALRSDLSLSKRMFAALPWLAIGIAVAATTSGADPIDSNSLFNLCLYVFNFLGGAIARFAPGVAPVLALGAFVSGLVFFTRADNRKSCLPWLGLFLFAFFSAALAALGREESFGTSQAFVTRYISFSSLYWIGWIGLLYAGTGVQEPSRFWRTTPVVLVTLLAMIDASQVSRKVAQVAADARVTMLTLCAQYPVVEPDLLGKIYFDQPKIAEQRLGMLADLGFPPFKTCARQ
ncbi:MAG: hypothetical protein ABJB01_11195 [Rudaea sp.]